MLRLCLVALALVTLSFSGHAQCVAPVLETFDSAVIGSTAPRCNAAGVGTLPLGWTNDPTATNSWRVWTGLVPTFNTGPQGDHTSGAGNYVFMESSSFTGATCVNGTEAILVTPCYDISSFTKPVLGFWYSMFGATMGTLEVQQLDSTGAWMTIWTLSGNQGSDWLLASIPVVPVNGTLSIRFRGIRGTSFTSDIALDDIFVTEQQFQINGANASLSIDGAAGNELAPAEVTICRGQSSVLTISSPLIGLPYDLMVASGQPVARALVSPAGSILNLDAFASSTVFFNQFFQSGWAGSLVAPLNGVAPTPPLTAQFAIADPSASDGIAFSAATSFAVNVSSTLANPIIANVADDGNTVVDIGCFVLYGSGYTEINVSTNGRITFGGSDTTFASQTITDFLTDLPSFGYWADFNLALSGTLQIFSPAPNVFRAEWSQAAYFGQGATRSNFGLEIDALTGTLVIDGILGVALNGGAANTSDRGWLGLSAGVGVVSDPGITNFGPGLSGTPSLPTDAIYTYGQAGALGGGADRLIFIPAGVGYMWAAF